MLQWAVSVCKSIMELRADSRNADRRIRFVSCSATISRPKEHMKAIFGLKVHSDTANVALTTTSTFRSGRGSNHRRWCTLGKKRVLVVGSATFSGCVPNRRGYPTHVMPHEEGCPCHPVLQGDFLSSVTYSTEADLFLDQKMLRVGKT